MTGPVNIPVRLAITEVAWGWDLGKARHMAVLVDGLQESVRPNADQAAKHLNGGLSEVAFRKHVRADLPLWTPPGHVLPDVPPDWEVRWAGGDGHRLIIRPDDPPGRRYVLLTGKAPCFTIRGCFTKEDVRQEWWQNPNGEGWAWWVPQYALRPLT